MSHVDCPDCVDRGTIDGCQNCGRVRKATAQERELDTLRRQMDRRGACRVYRMTAESRPNMVCSLGTKGCGLYHG